MGLFGKSADSEAASGTVTLIGEEARFHGVLSVKGSLRVDGVVEGDVTDAGEVEIGAGGRVKGNVSAERLIVAGVVEGDAVASRSIELFSSSRLIGDIKTPKLRIDEGAVFEGRSSMEQRQKTHKASSSAPPLPVESA